MSPVVDAKRPASRWRKPWVQYGLVALGLVLATVIRLPFEPWLQGRAPYGLYFPVLVATAWFIGAEATVMAALLSPFIAWYVFVPKGGPGIAEEGYLASLGIYAVAATSLIWLALRAAVTRRTADQAREAAERLAAIVSSSDDAIVGKDLDGTIRSWNSGAQRIFGYEPHETIGRSIELLIPPDRRSEEQHILATLRRGDRVEHFETVRTTKDGRPIEVSLSISPIRNEDGEVIGASKIARDVTERKRAERALALEREWFRVTLASIGDAVIATDIHSRVVFMNPVAEHMTGWSSTEAEGRECSEVFRILNEGTRVPVDSPVTRVLREGVVVGLANHTVLIAKDGIERPIDDSAAPIRGTNGRITGVVLVFHDVSERRAAELQRQTAGREREELLQSERAARGDAERANRMKDDFLATLSHELRTPLNAILGWTEILRRNGDQGTLERGLSVIERNTRLQAQLLSDLLDVSRIVSGKMRLELQLVELVAAVVQATETVKPSADAKNIRIETELDRSIEPIVGDAVRLQQIAWNLLSNAVKFSPAGSTVRVVVERHGKQARLTVSDAGAGIPAEFLPHLFDRFRQADTSMARRFGGLGLGLTIVKQLVELHGGSVSASSDGEGRGACFVVTLPLDAAQDGLSRARLSSTSGIDSAQLRGLRILVVEDDPDGRELTERLLTEHGCVVTAVDSANAALAALSTEHPDLLISDIGLPGEDGYSLIQRIRRLDRGDGGALPAIALTAFARSEDRTRALLAGFQAHVAKPVDAAELLATIASLANMLQHRAS